MQGSGQEWIFAGIGILAIILAIIIVYFLLKHKASYLERYKVS